MKKELFEISLIKEELFELRSQTSFFLIWTQGKEQWP